MRTTNTLTIRHGTKVSLLGLGITLYEPTNKCDTSLVISCGVHGDETGPIEIINKITQDLIEGKMDCNQRLLIAMGNIDAVEQATRYVDVNLNRLFCGAWRDQEDQNLPEVQRAAELERLVAKFYNESNPDDIKHNLHYDCHTAIKSGVHERFAIYPFASPAWTLGAPDLFARTLPDSQKAFLKAAGVEAVILQIMPTNTFSSYTSLEFGAQSFTLEMGTVEIMGQNDLGRLKDLDETLRSLILGKPLPESDDKPLVEYQVCHEIIKTNEQWQFLLPDDISNFSRYSPGTLIWKDGENSYEVGDEPEYMIFPHPDVPVGQRAGLMLRKIQPR